MDPLGSRVRVASNYRQQTIWIERAVELMPMDHQHPGTLGGGVDQRTCGRDSAEQLFNQASLGFIVISRQENHVGATAAPLHDLIHQLLLSEAPVPRRAQVKPVDYIANEIEGLCNVMAKKIE